MNANVEVVLIALGWSGAVALIGALLLLRVLRHRSLRVSLLALCLTTLGAVIAATLGTAHAMFLSGHDFGVLVLVSVVVAVLMTAVSGALAGTLTKSSRALVADARAISDVASLGVAAELRTPPHSAELGELARELDAARARLVESRGRELALESSRRELVAWVSHDLRTPLAGIRAMAEALEDDVAEDPARYRKQIRMEVDRLAGLVDDLFELAVIQAGALKLSLERISLSDLVSDTLAGADALARERGVVLRGHAVAEVAVRADERELSRLMTNLVVNAIRHTPSDGTVEIGLDAADGRAQISICDGCGGIPEEDLPRIFDVAWRGTHARTPSPDGGAGLGLAIVRGIVEAHAGEITVVNAGGGCRFEVSLPALI